MARLYPTTEAQVSEEQSVEWQKAITAARNNYPQLTRLMSANEKRKVIRDSGLPKPENVAFSEVPMIGLDMELTNQVMSLCGLKLFCALHYKQTGLILPRQGGVLTRFVTNADPFGDGISDEMLRTLVGGAKLIRGNVDLSYQFDYRYFVTSNGSFGAYLCAFRSSFALAGLVFMDAGAADDDLRADLKSPLLWNEPDASNCSATASDLCK